jgi:hypothetical protein
MQTLGTAEGEELVDYYVRLPTMVVVVALIASMVKGIASVREAKVQDRRRRLRHDGRTVRLAALHSERAAGPRHDAVPLRWVDLCLDQCRPGTSVRANGVPLVPGDLVPNALRVNVKDQ